MFLKKLYVNTLIQWKSVPICTAQLDPSAHLELPGSSSSVRTYPRRVSHEPVALLRVGRYQEYFDIFVCVFTAEWLYQK